MTSQNISLLNPMGTWKHHT